MNSNLVCGDLVVGTTGLVCTVIRTDGEWAIVSHPDGDRRVNIHRVKKIPSESFSKTNFSGVRRVRRVREASNQVIEGVPENKNPLHQSVRRCKGVREKPEILTPLTPPKITCKEKCKVQNPVTERNSATPYTTYTEKIPNQKNILGGFCDDSPEFVKETLPKPLKVGQRCRLKGTSHEYTLIEIHSVRDGSDNGEPTYEQWARLQTDDGKPAHWKLRQLEVIQ